MSTALDHNTTLAKPVAPEDLRRGEYVAVLSELVEFPSFLWDGDPHTLPPGEPIAVRFRPLDNGLPLRLRDLCLPFVLVKLPCGHHRTLDVRGLQLARLQEDYAKQVTKLIREQLTGKRRRRCCGDSVLTSS